MKDVNFLKEHGVDIDKSLELFGDIQTYNDTVGDFLLGVDEKVPKLKEYKDNKDMNNYAIYIHSLKRDAIYFGFSDLEKIAAEHELKSKAGDIYYIHENFDNLMNEVNKASNIVKEYLGDKEETIDENSEQKQIPKGEAYDSQTILVVDDSNIIRNFVSRVFKEDYKVGVAKDGAEAIGVITANEGNDNIKAILLDLNMPKVDGFAVLDYMREKDLFKKMPVSIISGDSTKETIDRAFNYEIVDMLGKPFNENDVKRVVEKTMYSKEIN